MTRRRVLLLGSVAVVAALAVVALIMLRPSAITSENAAKIKEGMTLAEVEAVLGGPARDETGGARVYFPPIGMYTESECRKWIGRNGAIVIVFTKEGRVCAAGPGSVHPRSEIWMDTVRRWLGL